MFSLVSYKDRQIVSTDDDSEGVRMFFSAIRGK